MSDANRLFYLRIALIVFGLTFIFGIHPLSIVWPSGWIWGQGHSHYLMMIIGIYATLGVFLLIASQDPDAHRSIIWFTVWSSVVHGAIMAALQRAGGAWSSIGRCARALPHSDHTRRIDAEDCASPSVGERCRPARNCNRPPRRDSWPATRSPCAFFFALRSDGQMIVSGRRAFAVPNTSSNVCRSARSTSAMVTEWPRSTRLVTP